VAAPVLSPDRDAFQVDMGGLEEDMQAQEELERFGLSPVSSPQKASSAASSSSPAVATGLARTGEVVDSRVANSSASADAGFPVKSAAQDQSGTFNGDLSLTTGEIEPVGMSSGTASPDAADAARARQREQLPEGEVDPTLSGDRIGSMHLFEWPFEGWPSPDVCGTWMPGSVRFARAEGFVSRQTG